MTESTPPARRGIPWRVALLGGAALVLAFIIGTQVIGVLYSIIAPPLPPLPPDVAVISHTNQDFGVDEWLYGTDQSACEVIRFYEANGTECYLTSDDCTTSGVPAEVEQVTQCTGERYFSIFAMRWKVFVASGYKTNGATHFRLTREVFWTGGIPPVQQLQP